MSIERLEERGVLRKSIYYLLLVLFAIVMALPFYWSIITSIKPDSDIFALPTIWFPIRFTVSHYNDAFSLIPYARYFMNSFYLASMGVVLNLFFGSLSGYAFAKLRFPGRDVLFKILLSSIMVPAVVVMIPQFLVLKNFPLVGGNNLFGQGGTGLLNSYWAVLLPGAAGAFGVFLMRQFFITLPEELIEAARIEGAHEFRIFWKIMLPLTTPALAALSIFTFQAGWNSFLWPLIVLNDPDKATIQMGLQAFTYNKSTDFGAMMAGSLVAILPMLLLFIFLQKYFIRGVALSGIKA